MSDAQSLDELGPERRHLLCLRSLQTDVLERIAATRNYGFEQALADLELILDRARAHVGFTRADLILVTNAHREVVAPDEYERTPLFDQTVGRWGWGPTTRLYYSLDGPLHRLQDCAGVTKLAVETLQPQQLWLDPERIDKLESDGVLASVPQDIEVSELEGFREIVRRQGMSDDRRALLERCEAWLRSARARPRTEPFLLQRRRWFDDGSILFGDPEEFESFGQYLMYAVIPVVRTWNGARQLQSLVTLRRPVGLPFDQPLRPDLLEQTSEIIDALKVPILVSGYNVSLSRALDAERAAKVAAREAHEALSAAQERLLQERDRAARAEQTEVLAGQMAHEVRGEVSPLLMALDSIQGRLPSPEAFSAVERALLSSFSSADPSQRRQLREAAEFLKAFGPSGEVASRLDALRSTGERIGRTVDGVMDFARLGKELAEEGAPVDLGLLATRVAAEFPSERLIVQLPAEPVTIRGHADRLHQAFRNLVRNAVEAVDEAVAQGGLLSPVMIGVTQEGDRALIRVKDQGVGMTPEVRSRLFTPMFTTKPTLGHGLGVATTLRIVQAHLGEISVESTAGSGSTFTVTLPLPRPN